MFRLDRADHQALLAGWRAMAGLLRTRDAHEATDVLVTAVRELGGTVVPALADDPAALPFDLSLGVGEAVLPSAPLDDPARERLELVLPILLEEARVAVARAWHDTLIGEQAEQDWLTGLLNRRGTSRLLPRLTQRDVMALIDLDHFKELNDSKGHRAGDEVLAAFGQVLREQARGEDRFARIGGDEFLGIFPGASVTQTVQALRRLREVWRERAPHPVTFSAGVAAVGVDGGAGAIGRADGAMYGAKAAGGDQVRAAVPGVPSPRTESPAEAPGRAAFVASVLDALEEGQARVATEAAYSFLDAGATLSEVVRDLLAPVQAEVGNRWQAGRWTVADEHVATGSVEAALAAASLRLGRVVGGFRHQAMTGSTAATRPVALVCPEGEWHELPARMFGTMLSEAGFEVTFFGPSLPADDLARALAARPFSVVVLSCTAAVNLPAAGRAVGAAHQAGVPVLAGGQGWGSSAKRADALGADGWAADLDGAVAELRRWAERPPARRVPEPAAPGPRLEDMTEASAVDIAAELARTEAVAGGALTTGVPAVLGVLRHLDAAMAVHDPSVFHEHIEWLSTTLAARGVDKEAVVMLLAAVDRGLGAGQRTARELMHSALAAAGAG